MSKDEKLKERFVRWQALQILHTSDLSNRLMSTGLVVIGFLVTLFSFDSTWLSGKVEKILLFVGFFFVFSSVVIGIVGGASRLCGFRATTQLIKSRRENDEQKVNFYKSRQEVYDNNTRFCLSAQIVTMIFGIILLGATFGSYLYSNL